MVEIIPALITLAYVSLVVILLVIVWRVWRALAEFEESLEISHKNGKKYFSSLANSIGILVQNQRHPLDEGQILIEKLKDIYDLSAKAAENESLQNQIREAEDKSVIRETELQKISQEKDEALQALEQMRGEFQALETLSTAQLKEKEDLKARVAGYETCLPIDQVDRLYHDVAKVCDLDGIDRERMHYVFSRLAVIAACKELKVKEDDKIIMLRDAFSAFDNALYAHFKDEKELLRILRDCFKEELKPLLDGRLIFSWPCLGQKLNRAEHTPENENGLGIITDVKTAVLFKEPGKVSTKAIVCT